jgi:outer membrane cobalamin receptor
VIILMVNMKRVQIIFFLLLVQFSTVISQDADRVWEGDTILIDEVSIRKSRTLLENGISKTKIDSMVMEEKISRSLADLLSEHSSVFIKSYGRGTMASASFRGTSPSHTRVMWNGIDINSPMLGMVDFSTIPVFFADEISLIPGSGSMMETSGALGGLISLNTKPDWSKQFSGKFLQGIGSYGTIDNFLKLSAGNQKFQSGTRIFYSTSDNDFKYINRSIIDSVDLESGIKYHPLSINNNAGYTQYGLLQEFFLRPGDNSFFNISVWAQHGERSIPFLSANESATDGMSNQQNDKVYRISSAWKRFGDKVSFQYQTGLNIQILDYAFFNEVNGIGMINLINSRSRSLSIMNKAETEINQGAMGVVHFRLSHNMDYVNTNESVTNSGYDKHRGSGSASLSWVWQYKTRIRTRVHFGEEIFGGRYSPFLYNFSAEYHILGMDRMYLRTSFAKNAKFPGMNDMYYQPGGNPDLLPEIAKNREIGLVSSGNVGMQAFGLTLNGYYSEVRDWILWLPSFNGYWEPRNVQKVEISGFELGSSLSGQIKSLGYKLKADYAYTRSVNQSQPLNHADTSPGKQLPFIPLHSANSIFGVSKYGYSLSYIWNYYSERFINSSNDYYSKRDKLYPYFMNQISIAKQMSKGQFTVDASASIHNLFDEEYRSIIQRPMPGRNFTFLLKIQF